MKTKNIAFSGVMAAILLSAGAATAVPQIASKDYVDAMAGDAVTSAVQQVESKGYQTAGDVTAAVADSIENADGAIKTALDTKADADDLSALTGRVTTAESDINTLEGTVGGVGTDLSTEAKTIVGAINEINNDVYRKVQTYTQEEVRAEIGKIQAGDVDLQGYVKESTYNTDMASKADKTTVEGLSDTVDAQGETIATHTEQISALQNADANLQTAIDTKVTSNDVVNAITTALADGGAIDTKLDTKADAQTVTDLTATVNEKADATAVAEELVKKADKTAVEELAETLKGKQDTLTAGTNIDITDGRISVTGKVAAAAVADKALLADKATTAETADKATTAETAGSATKATQDASGRDIAGTYATITGTIPKPQAECSSDTAMCVLSIDKNDELKWVNVTDDPNAPKDPVE